MATIHEFGPFRLDPDAEIVFRGTTPAALGKRAVALLRLLLEKAGSPVSKDALIEAAWPGLAIEDSNLTVQIAALRRMFGEIDGGAGWIETLPRRGYRYVGPRGATSVRSASASPPASAEKPIVAVFAFANLSGDPDQDYFADGVVDDIVIGLSRIKWLQVIARNSTPGFRGRPIDVTQAADKLGARYVLEGSVRRAANRVRISCQMIDAAAGAHVWAERYEREYKDIFALQDEIALSIVGAIEPGLRKAEAERAKRKRPDSLDAYDLVLQAQPDMNSGMPERIVKALPLLERALALDPAYALAHAFAAMCHHCLFLRAGLDEKSRAASIRHARDAIIYGQDDALALTFAGFSIGMDAHDHAAAFTAFEAALAIRPSSALTYIFGSVICGWTGNAEQAIEWGNRGMRLSPHDPWSFAALHAIALGEFSHGRFAEAASAAQKAVQANPAHSISYMLLAAALSKAGQPGNAAAAAKRVMELQPGFRLSLQFQGANCAPELAASLSDTLRASGLPE